MEVGYRMHLVKEQVPAQYSELNIQMISTMRSGYRLLCIDPDW